MTSKCFLSLARSNAVLPSCDGEGVCVEVDAAAPGGEGGGLGGAERRRDACAGTLPTPTHPPRPLTPTLPRLGHIFAPSLTSFLRLGSAFASSSDLTQRGWPK